MRLRVPVRLSSLALAAFIGVIAAMVYAADRELIRAGNVLILRIGLWALGATLGILARTVAPGTSRPLLDDINAPVD